MLPQQIAIVKATIPVLQQYGETITATFYESLFEEYPSLLNIFNPASQRNGNQARSLAARPTRRHGRPYRPQTRQP